MHTDTHTHTHTHILLPSLFLSTDCPPQFRRHCSLFAPSIPLSGSLSLLSLSLFLSFFLPPTLSLSLSFILSRTHPPSLSLSLSLSLLSLSLFLSLRFPMTLINIQIMPVHIK